MSNNIVLSICIATFNRAMLIGETLDSIVSQTTNEVEIVIVDGASTDNTGEIVKDYQKKFPVIRYIRLAAKGGFDQDCCRAVELARGKYCWLFSDDDILKPGAIKAVLDEFQHNYGLILVNAEIRNVNLSKVLKKRCLNFVDNRIYQREDSEQLFIDVASYLSFIGCIVIKRSLWNAREKKTYFGTLFVHVAVIFQSPIVEKIEVLANPMISIRYGNSLWTDKSFEVSLLIWPNLIWSFSDFSEPAKDRVCPREPWHRFTTLLIYRARGAYTLKEYKKFLMKRLDSTIDRFFTRLIAQLPGVLLNFGLYVYFTIFRIYYTNAEIYLVDLKNSTYYYKHYVASIMAKYISLKD
jgi:glycosyltransferase involved in cell wall biosynthesis